MRILQRTFILGFVAIALLTSAPLMAAQSTTEDKVVKDGAVISLQYTLSGEDGKTIESNKGREPLKYTQGAKRIIHGLEKALAGMKVGEEKRVEIKPEDGYGPINEHAIQEFPKEKVPQEMQKVGAELMLKSPHGQAFPVRVKEIKEKTVLIDMNHPMAGKTLVFDVKILEIQAAATPQPSKPAQPAAPPQPAKPNPSK
jgi:FKBP-type peptidyl-prolyl cis-trans isomerase 2